MTKQATLSIGALAQATSVPVNTLRTWERRHGFPRPVRLPSGHRRFHADQIVLIRWIIRALEAGYRPSALESLHVDGLRSLVSAARPAHSKSSPDSAALIESWLDHVDDLNAEELSTAMTKAWSQFGAIDFLNGYVAHLLRRIGSEWADGRFTIAQEHVASACIMNFLSLRWRELTQGASGPTVVLGTLPGERHALGLHQAAVVVAMHGFKVHFVGVDTPAVELAQAARALRARAILVSISVASPREETLLMLDDLREHMPRGMELVLGGGGVPDSCPEQLQSMQELDTWARAISTFRGISH